MTSQPATTSPDGGAVDPRELYDRIQADDPVAILDVRSEADYEEWHIDGPEVDAVNVPGEEFEGDLDADLLDSLPEGDPLVVVCAKGVTSADIAATLRDHGIDALNLDEGMEGWARVYVATPVERYDGSGTLYQYQRPSSGCLAYFLVDGDEAAVFDPLRAFLDRYRSDVADHEANLSYVFDTHIHADHVSGVRRLMGNGTVGVLPEPAIERGVTYADEVQAATDGEEFHVGDAVVTAVHTPGHTSGMTSYRIDDSVLLTGDGLFTESVARPDLEHGDEGATDAARTLYETLQNVILDYPDDLLIAGGHYSGAAQPAEDGTYTATLGDLRERMEMLSLSEDDFVERVLEDMPPRPTNYQTIIATNLGQESVTDRQAFELELGPNNCATSADAL
ncbi:MBL fold metallo-hydrolase [Halanaeroarchaeum sulfurireducens]|uniref:Fused rhodanese domain-containing protein/hydrolase n=1 Tax=Halanaeroarchaeum sulfurireducens TaxID=1604004 RepID=A0A0F7PC13_9EURY|nr:MBL fold metallo-hydrolase [Halanaeroarchaeum sulfurireducens]AKH97685.1 fused rhodanese domain-containing protein/hydrolase [Halanaeroarchaeum sulfurireducens]ALG82080.1 fused rhodanese domain-containing protein/hydrolase [Halanaeroarchaeum sulfurireducens]